MKNIWRAVQIALSAFGGVLGWFLGGLDGILMVLISFAVLDYITGVACAIIEHKLSSRIGFAGIIKKLLIFLLVGAANLMDRYLIGSGDALRTATIFFFVSNEGVSLLENASRLGLPIPNKLREVLMILHDKAEGEEAKKDDDSKQNTDGK